MGMTCPTGAAHALLPLHPSFMSLGAFAPLNGPPARPPLWTSGRGCGDVEGEAGTLFTLRPPCWPAEAGGGPGDSTPLYRQNLLSTIWPLGRQVPAGRRPARNLQAGRSRCRGRRGLQEENAGGEKLQGGRQEPAQLVHRNDCLSPSLLSQHHSTYFMTLKQLKLESVWYSLASAVFQTF